MPEGNGKSFTEMSMEEIRGQWTPEQRLQAGDLSAQALSNPIFNVISELITQKHFREVINTEPKEELARKSSYYEARAHQNMLLLMASMVGDAQRIVAERQAQNDPVEQEKRRLDEQGYGLNFNQ